MCYGFCPDERAWKREMRRLNITDAPYPTTDNACSTFESTKSNKHCVIVTINERKRLKLQVVGLIVHEAMHVWRFVRENMGEREPSLEFEAYAMQAIAQNLIAAYEKTRGGLLRAR